MAALDLAHPELTEPLAPQRSIDARPMLPISTSGASLWDQTARLRDALAKEIDAYFATRDITVWVRMSQPGVYPAVVAVDSWLPVGQTDRTAKVDRSSLRISISVAPYQERPILYEVELQRHSKAFKAEYWDLSNAELREMLAYLLDGGPKPGYFRSRTPLPLRILGAFLPFVHGPRNRLIAEARPRFWTLPVAVFLTGLICAAIALMNGGVDEYGDPDPTAGYVAAALFAIFGAIGGYWLAARRPVVQAIPKQPARCPRREFRVDSWHVSVPCAGEQFEGFKQRIYAAASAAVADVSVAVEKHQNITPTGFEERERMVLGKGQATLHVHVYPYGRDAFVGWDSHLNWNRWEEGSVLSSTVAEKRRVQYKALQVGVHLPNEFDLIECDVLSETTHRRLVSEIKAYLKEREIEDDLDFKIIRGDRARALEEGKDVKELKGVKGVKARAKA